LEKRISQLSTEVETLFVEARDRGRSESADHLNQAVRRIRQAEDLDILAATLLDASGAFSAGSALFTIEEQVAKGRRMRGVPEATSESFKSLEIPLASAAALAGAVETRDPVIAATTPSEIADDMARLAGHTGEARVSIFPLVVRDGVPALLYAWGSVQGSAMELLTQVASGVWSELSRPAPVELVHIAPAAMAYVQSISTGVAELPAVQQSAGGDPSPASRQATSWEQLSSAEQQLHLRAQRYARVQVAEMRLYEADAVQSGRLHSKLYAKLQKPIDTARNAFRETYFSPCPSMVDYLHLELVRTLANEDPELLGKEYPGPMA
jgi:hypothetical protein